MSDIDNIIAALNLEYGAHRRYAYQIERSPFTEINRILEGVRRTEGDHVEAMFAALKRRQAEHPEIGRGFAGVLTHLKLNLAFEEQALQAYRRFSIDAEDPALKKTFQRLMQSESGHLHLFRDLIARIEANEFPVRVYCPVCGWELDFGANPPAEGEQRCPQCKALIALEIVDGDFTPVIR